jgi:hypothetical protein
MAKAFDHLTPVLADFVAAQRMFFVATAPLADDGHVNLSPKGYDSFRVLGPNRVAYLDLTGSSAETVAHVRENARITLMFCAYEGAPQIVRLYGRGRAVLRGDTDFDELAAWFPPIPGVRSVIDVAVHRVSSSCGYAVPLMHYEGDRSRLTEWAVRKGRDGIAEYQARKNATSLDGLPALDA